MKIPTRIHREVFKSGNRVLDDGLDRIAASVKAEEHTLVVFNPLSWERKGVVEFEYQSDKGLIYLEGNNGEISECQETGAGVNIYASLVKGVLPKGYTSYKIIETIDNLKNAKSNIHISKFLLENKFCKISLDEKGLFASIFDKQTNREVLKPGEKGNVLQAFEDKPMKGPWGRYADNWNLDIFYSEKMWEINDVESVEIIETGPVRGTLRIIRRFL